MKRLARAEVAAVVLVGLGALGFQLWLPSTHVAEADYLAVAQVLTAEGQPGDAVLLAPWWTERARLYVPQSVRVVGYQGSDGADLEEHPRVWVLSQPQQPRAGMSDFHRGFDVGRTSLGPARHFGNLTLELYKNGRHTPVVFDAAASLSSARVSIQEGGQRTDCQFNGRGWQCPEANPVQPLIREVHFAPYSCVQFEAPSRNRALVMELNAPADAEATTLQAGYIWEYGSCPSPNCTPTQVVWEVDGNTQAMELPTANDTMHRLTGPAVRAGAPLRVSLSSPNPSSRVVCVVMRGIGRAP